jgi:alpha-glucosidase
LIGKIYKNPYGMEISNKNGDVLYRDLRGRSYKRDLQGRIYHYCEIDSVNDCFYGFG